MTDLDPFADEEPWRVERAEGDELDDWAGGSRTTAVPRTPSPASVPFELRHRANPPMAERSPTGRSDPPTAVQPATPPRNEPRPGAPAAPLIGQGRSIRARGPVVALLVPLVAGAITFVLWRVVPCNSSACVAPGAAGWVFGSLAVPTAPVAGIPWQTGAPVVALALASSLAVWLGLGRWAAARATSGPVGTWREYARQLRSLAIGLWLGVLAGLAGVAIVMTQV